MVLACSRSCSDPYRAGDEDHQPESSPISGNSLIFDDFQQTRLKSLASAELTRWSSPTSAEPTLWSPLACHGSQLVMIVLVEVSVILPAKGSHRQPQWPERAHTNACSSHPVEHDTVSLRFSI